MDKHYSKLSSGENIVCTDTMQAFSREPSLTSLNEPSDLEEVVTTVINLKFNKVKNKYAISGEAWSYSTSCTTPPFDVLLVVY